VSLHHECKVEEPIVREVQFCYQTNRKPRVFCPELTKRFQERSVRLLLNGTIQNTRLCFDDPSNVGAKLWDDFRNLVYDHIDETFRRVSCMASAGEGVTGSIIMTTSFGPLQNCVWCFRFRSSLARRTVVSSPRLPQSTS